MRDIYGLFDFVIFDVIDFEFVFILELNGLDRQLKVKVFFFLRVRFFLNVLIDCKLLYFAVLQDEGSRLFGFNDLKFQYVEGEIKILDRFVYVLDILQFVKFYWQWVEFRFFLSE